MYDLIIIGAGAIGSAAAYHAAKAGYSVLLLEQYGIDHQRGSSYGYSRIIRYAYDHPVYVEMAKLAFPAWQAFEAEAGETLYVRTGGIDFAPPAEPLFRQMLDTLTACSIDHVVLNASEARELFPQFHLDADMEILYQRDAGILRASRAVQAQVRLARQYGADVRENAPVTKITPLADSVEVTAAGETFSASRLIIASGGWLKPMLQPLGLDIPLQPIAAQENYFTPLDAAPFAPERFPVWIGHLQSRYGNILYGLPPIDGSGVKIGLHTGAPIDPESPDRTPDVKTSEDMHEFARRCIPQAAGELISSRVCIYTLTPDEHFIIDQHPAHPQIVIASCCSGHAFKFSTVLGRILRDLAIDGAVDDDISLFSLSRFASVER